MCGRFVTTQATSDLAAVFDAAPSNDLPDPENYNICPTDSVITVVSNQGTRRLRSMRWGFLPEWYKTPSGGPLLINARSDTLAEKPAFRAAARQRRCLIPVAGFYEWTRKEDVRLPWYIYPRQEGTFAFAGVWQSWNKGPVPIDSFAIVTTDANRPMSQLHHRMPLILGQEAWALWLGEEGHGAARLMVPAPDDMFGFHRVDMAVNSNRATGSELTKPVAE